MPYQTVTNDFQVVLFAIADELVGHTEVEDTLGRSQRLGLHTILSHSTIKVLIDYCIGFRYLSVALPLVDSCTNQAVLPNSVLQSLRPCGTK